MKNSLWLLLFLITMGKLAAAQTWYVSGTGNDGADGRTATTAFRTLQKAVGVVGPGDVVIVGDGIYTNADRSDGGAVLSITASGTKEAWITWKAAPGAKPEIRPTGWCGIQVSGSYNIIDGFTIIGANDSLVLLKAQEDAKRPNADPRFNTNGIFVNGRGKKPGEKPHHTIIRNCTVGKCPGGGIQGIETDYLTIEDCKVYENAWYMRYGGSGISTLQNWAYDDAPGYHVIIQRNYVWNNKTMVAWEKIGRLSDGNGIILDVTDQDEKGATNPNADTVVKNAVAGQPAPTKARRPEWKGRTLVANNVSAFNGGSGIHTFRTKYVDIINNTTYHNGNIVGYPELFANSSEDVVILNNIIVPRPAGKVTSNSSKNVNIRWDYNLYPIAQDALKGPNDIVADPGLTGVQPDLSKPDLRLARNSRAINTGTRDLMQQTAIDHKTRPKGAGIDRGAYEQ